VRRWPVLGVTLAVVWLFVRGVTLEPMVILGEFLIGLGIGLPIAFVFRRFYLPSFPVGSILRGLPALVAYVGTFLVEVLTANLEVAYRVLHPSLPIDPSVVEVPLRVETDLAITTIANSITLTPGTLTMDYDEERNALYVHALAGERDRIVQPIRRWEDYALRIFDEEGDPRDRVPQLPDLTGGDRTDRSRDGDGDGH